MISRNAKSAGEFDGDVDSHHLSTLDSFISGIYLGVAYNKDTGNKQQDPRQIVIKILEEEFAFDTVKTKLANHILNLRKPDNIKRIPLILHPFIDNLNIKDLCDQYYTGYYYLPVYYNYRTLLSKKKKELSEFYYKSKTLSKDALHLFQECTILFNRMISIANYSDFGYAYLMVSCKENLSHIFSSRFVVISSKLQLLHPSNKRGLKAPEVAMNSRLLKKDLSKFATFKASSTVRPLEPVHIMTDDMSIISHIRKLKTRMSQDDFEIELLINDINKYKKRSSHKIYQGSKHMTDDISIRLKCVESVLYELKKNPDVLHMDEFAKKVLDELIIYIQIFKKNQLSKVREIMILTMASRICINMVESYGRKIIENDTREMLTSGPEKLRHYYNMTRNALYKIGSKDADLLYFTEDKKTWCQQFMPMIFSHMYYPATYNMNKDLMTMISDILSLHQNKIIEYPRELINEFLSSRDEIYNNDALNKAKHIFRMSKEPFFKNTSNMCQGILHYSSTYLHVCSLSLRDYFLDIYKASINSNLPDMENRINDAIQNTTGIKDHSQYKINKLLYDVHTLVTSDDSIELRAHPRIQNIGDHILYTQMDKMLLRIKSICWKLTSMCNSAEKGVMSFVMNEFNSIFRTSSTHAAPLIKFAIRCVEVFNTDSFSDFVYESYQSCRQYRENGGTSSDTLYFHLLNYMFADELFNHEVIISKSKTLSALKDLNILPYDLLNYPITPTCVTDFTGPEAYNYNILLNLSKDLNQYIHDNSTNDNYEISNYMRDKPDHYRSLTILSNFYMRPVRHLPDAIRIMDGGDIWTKKLRIKTRIAPTKILMSKRKKLKLDIDQIIHNFAKDPFLVFRDPRSHDELFSKCAIKLYGEGASKSLRVLSPIMFFQRYTGIRSGTYYIDPIDDQEKSYDDIIQNLLRNHTTIIDPRLMCKTLLNCFPNRHIYEHACPYMDIALIDSRPMSKFSARRPQEFILGYDDESLNVRASELFYWAWKLKFQLPVESQYKQNEFMRNWIRIKEINPMICDDMITTLKAFHLNESDSDIYALFVYLSNTFIKPTVDKIKLITYANSSRNIDTFYKRILKYNTIAGQNMDLNEEVKTDIKYSSSQHKISLMFDIMINAFVLLFESNKDSDVIKQEFLNMFMFINLKLYKTYSTIENYFIGHGNLNFNYQLNLNINKMNS